MAYCADLPYVPDAADYHAALADLSWPVWLDSAGMGRYDILCAEPFANLLTRGNVTEISGAGGGRSSAQDPFDLLREELGARSAPVAGLPFCGGAVGYWGYDLARRILALPERAEDAERLPEMAVGLYDWAVVIDHHEKKACLVSVLRHPATEGRLPGLRDRLLTHAPASPREPFDARGGIVSDFSRAGYLEAYERVQGYLHAGDCYQVNLAQRFAVNASGDALSAYLALRRMSPAPYSAFLDLPHAQILSASPECFLRVRDGLVTTRPIKGTRPRAEDAEMDARLREELGRCAKDRAENLMIVDLLRNDLGRCCVPGSVRTPALFEVESYAQVHHLVSTVEGRLAEGQDAVSLLRGAFPGGSITGAPKRRAMEIIEELEPKRRGVYCGAIGYVGFDGNMDSNIAIRTLVYADGVARFYAGGGIVADSDGPEEYQETLDKAAAMMRLLREFGADGSA